MLQCWVWRTTFYFTLYPQGLSKPGGVGVHVKTGGCLQSIQESRGYRINLDRYHLYEVISYLLHLYFNKPCTRSWTSVSVHIYVNPWTTHQGSGRERETGKNTRERGWKWRSMRFAWTACLSVGSLEKLLLGLTAQSDLVCVSVCVRVSSWTYCQGICQSYRLSRLSVVVLVLVESNWVLRVIDELISRCIESSAH